MEKSAFYQQHLDQVSRSFAYCIANLKNPLKEWVGLSYLLFRVLDTIEDAPWKDSESKKSSFDQFHLCLNGQLQFDWTSQLPSAIPDVEKQLMQSLPTLIQDFYLLPLPIQQTIKKSLIMMSFGMQRFASQTHQGQIRLKNLKEVNQYCFFVAGLVGELLTDLIGSLLPKTFATPELYFNSFRFGMFLQKINLLKDQSDDEQQGRFLVPNRQELLLSLKQDSEGAIDYILQMPVTQKEYRLFCAWSLFLGLSSLPWIENSFLKKLMEKIPRPVTQALFSKIELVIHDNQALVQLFKESTQKLRSHRHKPVVVKSDGRDESKWLTQIYQGQLSSDQLGRLGVV